MTDEELVTKAIRLFNSINEGDDHLDMDVEFHFHSALGALTWTKEEARDWLNYFIIEETNQ